MNNFVAEVLACLLSCSVTVQTMKEDKSVTAKVQSWVTRITESTLPVDISWVSTPSFTSKSGSHWYSVHYREFPMAVRPPDPMNPRNLVVESKSKTLHFGTRQELDKLARDMFRPVRREDLTDFALDWLRVSSVFSQDGFFEFQFKKFNIKVKDAGRACQVDAESPVVEKAGDTGKLRCTLSFNLTDEGYVLVSVKDDDTVVPGIRPICQATLLLDQNPKVRKIAERDLLVMGRAALGYLEEQRTHATGDLRKEIERVIKKVRRGERL